MKPRIDSRTSQVDTEKCVDQAGGRYDLVIAAAQRLRELKRRGRETNTYVTPIDALLEMQAGQIDMIDYMAKVK
jgi:DNA-directed RNA polymerase omega subunit